MTREEKENQAQLEWLRKWKERRKEKRDVRKKSLFYKILRKLGIIKDYEEDIRTRMELDGGYDVVHGCYVQPNYWVLPKVFQFPADDEI